MASSSNDRVLRGGSGVTDARANALAVEQSVEMPLTAISDDFVRTEIVGRVETVREVQPANALLRVDENAPAIR